jgi:hypothetical protein
MFVEPVRIGKAYFNRLTKCGLYFNDSLSFETMMQSRAICDDTRYQVQMTETYVMTFTWWVSPDNTQELVTD